MYFLKSSSKPRKASHLFQIPLSLVHSLVHPLPVSVPIRFSPMPLLRQRARWKALNMQISHFLRIFSENSTNHFPLFFRSRRETHILTCPSSNLCAAAPGWLLSPCVSYSASQRTQSPRSQQRPEQRKGPPRR